MVLVCMPRPAGQLSSFIRAFGWFSVDCAFISWPHFGVAGVGFLVSFALHTSTFFASSSHSDELGLKQVQTASPAPLEGLSAQSEQRCASCAR